MSGLLAYRNISVMDLEPPEQDYVLICGTKKAGTITDKAIQLGHCGEWLWVAKQNVVLYGGNYYAKRWAVE